MMSRKRSLAEQRGAINLPPRRLRVALYRRNTSAHELRSLFELCGELDTISMHISNNPNRYSLVTYRHSTDAAMAISKCHQLHGRILSVTFAQHQPRTMAPRAGSHTPEVMTDPNKTIMKMLNDDCLLHIFKMLSPIRDYHAMRQVNRRFRDLIDLLAQSTKRVVLSEMLPLGRLLSYEDFKDMLNIIGQHVTHIEMNENEVEYATQNCLTDIQRRCGKLQHLKMTDFQYLNLLHRKTISTSLTFLSLRNCTITDKMVKSLSNKCSNITHLDLSFNIGITGKHIDRFFKLRTLKLEDCANFDSLYLRNIALVNPKLCSLNVLNCPHVEEETIFVITKEFPELEELIITIYYSNSISVALKTLGQMQHLRVLRLSCSGNCDDMVEAMAERNIVEALELSGPPLTHRLTSAISRLTNLRELNINFTRDKPAYLLQRFHFMHMVDFRCCACDTITDDNLVDFVRNSPNLQTLDVSHCHNITNRAIQKIVDVLNGRDNSAKLTMFVGETTLTPETTPAYLAKDTGKRLNLHYDRSSMLEFLDDQVFQHLSS